MVQKNARPIPSFPFARISKSSRPIGRVKGIPRLGPKIFILSVIRCLGFQKASTLPNFGYLFYSRFLSSGIRVIFSRKLILNVVIVLMHVYEYVHEHDLGCGVAPALGKENWIMTPIGGHLLHFQHTVGQLILDCHNRAGCIEDDKLGCGSK